MIKKVLYFTADMAGAAQQMQVRRRYAPRFARRNAASSKAPTFLDLFAGGGGASLGFEAAGFRCAAAIEYDRDSCATYRRNFPETTVIEKNIQSVDKGEIVRAAGTSSLDVIIGGPPCQGFSMAGRPGRTFVEDSRNALFKEFVRITSMFMPKYFVMENVQRLHYHDGGNTRKLILKCFERLGYTAESAILNAAEYGVPQKRYRIFIIGNRLGRKNPFPRPADNTMTIRDALDGLPPLAAGQSSDIPNHEAMSHSQQMLRKMSYVGDGGTRDQIPKRYRPRGGDVRKYIRYNSKMPSVCVTGDMRKIFHYSQNRALTVRELARLQSFPDSFVFYGGSLSQQQQVGNAVPPMLAVSVARGIFEQLSGGL